MNDADRTPPLGTEGFTSRMYRVAEEVFNRSIAKVWRDCENEQSGPVCKVTKRIERLEDVMDETRNELRDTLGELRGRSKRDMLWLKLIGVVLAIGTLGLGAANIMKRDANTTTQAEILHKLQSIQAELDK